MLFSRFSICFVFLAYGLSHGESYADEPPKMEAFSEVLKSLVLERQKPQLYEVKYRLLDQAIDQGNAKDGSGSFGRRIETMGLIRFDEVVGKLYVEERSQLEDVLDSSRERSWKDHVKNNYRTGFKLILPGRKYIFDQADNRFEEKESSKEIESEIPLDFKIYGLCESSDLRKGKSFEEIAARLHRYFGKWECPIDKDGIALIDVRNEIYKIDTKRGYWPIEKKAFTFFNVNGKRVPVTQYGQDIKLIEVNGNWVQKRVDVIRNPSYTLSYEFDWVSYNEPLPPKAFDLNEILKERWSEKEKQAEKDKAKSP